VRAILVCDLKQGVIRSDKSTGVVQQRRQTSDSVDAKMCWVPESAAVSVGLRIASKEKVAEAGGNV